MSRKGNHSNKGNLYWVCRVVCEVDILCFFCVDVSFFKQEQQTGLELETIQPQFYVEEILHLLEVMSLI